MKYDKDNPPFPIQPPPPKVDDETVIEWPAFIDGYDYPAE